MATVMTRINSNVLAKARATKPEYDSLAAHLSRLIEKGLDSSVKMTEALKGPESYSNNIYKEDKVKRNSTKKADPFSSKNLKVDLIPKDLQDCAETFIEWWAARHKKGASCSKNVAEREFRKLRQWTVEEREKAIQDAIYKPWTQLYAPKSLNGKPETERNNPLYPDFTGIAAKQREEKDGVLRGIV